MLNLTSLRLVIKGAAKITDNGIVNFAERIKELENLKSLDFQIIPSMKVTRKALKGFSQKIKENTKINTFSMIPSC